MCHITPGAELSNFPAKVFDIARGLGIEIQTRLLPDKIAGILHKFPGHSYLYLNSTHCLERQRFTVAHEIAHQILDPAGTYLAHTNTINSVCERRANKYAAEILMPEREVFRCTDRSMSIADMLFHFGVSEEAMLIRLDEVGVGAKQESKQRKEG